MSGLEKQLSIVFIAAALALVLAIAPDRGTFPSTSDIVALQTARASGDDLVEWRWLARFVSLHPHDARLWERMAVLDYQNGLCRQAVLEFNLATTYGSISGDNQILHGKCLLELGKSQEVIELLSPYLIDFSKPDGLEMLIARAYLNQGLYEQALVVLKDWTTTEQQNPQALYTLGLYQALTEPSQSLENLQNAAQINPDYDSAYRELQTAVNTARLSENQAYQAVVIGQAYGNLDEWELAEFAFLSAVKVDPNYADAHAWLGEARQQLGRDGSSELQQALDLNPSSILAQALNALFLRRQGKANEAMIFLDQIAEAEPANPAWQMALGQTSAELGNLEQALDYYLNALAMEPQNASIWQALAEFCFAYQYEVQQTGIPAAYRAVLISPASPRSLDLAGQAALVESNLDSAKAYLRNAIELDPRYAPAHLHLALVLLQQGDIQAARQELEKAATLGDIEAEHILFQITGQ